MRFLLHTCYDPAKEDLPKYCSCQHRISKTERDTRREAGELYVSNDGRTVAKFRPRILTGPPQATTISKGNIEAAFLKGIESEQKRIAIYRSVHYRKVLGILRARTLRGYRRVTR
jgi:hypothetical protein